jgi:hypothetical protein
MQKIFSARLDEAVLNEMDRVTRRAKMTKKQFLEEAIRARARELSASLAQDVWDETRGAWKRRGRPATTVRAARTAFRRSIERHQR